MLSCLLYNYSVQGCVDDLFKIKYEVLSYTGVFSVDVLNAVKSLISLMCSGNHSTVLVSYIWMSIMQRFGAWCRDFLVVGHFHWRAYSCHACLWFQWGALCIPLLVHGCIYVWVWVFCVEFFPISVAHVAVVVFVMHCHTFIFPILI